MKLFYFRGWSHRTLTQPLQNHVTQLRISWCLCLTPSPGDGSATLVFVLFLLSDVFSSLRMRESRNLSENSNRAKIERGGRQQELETAGICGVEWDLAALSPACLPRTWKPHCSNLGLSSISGESLWWVEKADGKMWREIEENRNRGEEGWEQLNVRAWAPGRNKDAYICRLSSTRMPAPLRVPLMYRIPWVTTFVPFFIFRTP